jgi:hypothetical protein
MRKAKFPPLKIDLPFDEALRRAMLVKPPTKKPKKKKKT